jgi:putative ABC transport system permease protein
MCARSELRERWLSWGAAALVLGLAAAVVLTTAAGARRTSSAYSRYLAAGHGADVLVSPNATGFPHLYPALARTRGVALVAPVIGYGGALIGRPRTPVLIQAGTDRAFGFRVERPKITAGRMLAPRRPDEVVADLTAARELHLHPGSRLHMVIAGRDEELPDRAHDPVVTLLVVGIGVTRDNVVPDNALASAPTLFAGPGFSHRFGPRFYAFDGAEVDLRPAASTAGFSARAQRIARGLSETGGGLFVADEAEQASKVQHAIRPQAVALGAFALLAAVTAIFAVGQVVSRQVAASADDNAKLRALGMTRRQVVRARLMVVGLAATVGALVAIGLSVGASSWMPIGPARIAEPHPGVDWDWLVLGGGFVAIVALTVAGAAWPAWRATPTESGQLADARTGRRSHVAGSALRAGLPASAAMGIGQALDTGRARRSVPLRSAIAGLAIAVAAISGALTFGTNLGDLVHTPRRYGQTWDITADAQFSPIPSRRIDRRLRREPGAVAWTFGMHGDLEIDHHRVSSVELVRRQGELLAPTGVEGRAARTAHEVALGSKTLDAIHAHVGDRIAVASADSRSHPRRMRVVGSSVFPFFGQGSFTPTGLGIGAQTGRSSTRLAGATFVLIRVAPGAGHDASVARIAHDLVRSDLCGLDNQCQVTTTSRPVDILNYARVQTTPVVLAVVLAFLAFLVLSYLLITSLRSRRHDFAIYKTLGFTRRQVSSTVAWQATTITALALLIGIPVGIVAGRLAWVAFTTTLGIPPDATVPAASLVIIAAVALLLANALAAVPGRAVGREEPASLLRTD